MRPLPVSPTSDGARIGARLRATRRARGYTLEQLATASGLTKGFLSRAERDEASLSVASLVTLCEVMSINPGSLFSAPDVEVIRRDEAPAINLGGTGVSERLMSPRGQSKVQLIHTAAEPGATGGPDLYTINCEVEVVYVLRGEIEVVFADRRERLGVGDALTLRGSEPHTWHNPSATEEAEVVWVLTPAPWSGSA
ncbi:MAG: helix-turn-helix protein [Marmoricola sp.]|jgi:transcriptional regulator with XRE-family HTH domain|nr:helix-turn-helix protein [Marmoricola sp.]